MKLRARLKLYALGWALLLPVAMAAGAAEPAPTSCTICHQDPDLFDEEGLAVVHDFAADVHGEVGLSCHDCHGGNPDPALADDLFSAMDPGYEANPYVGAPARTEIPDFCGGCHSDPAYMRRFRPDARVDQEEEYWTSQHGRALARGDAAVATCVDCHGVHGILTSGNPDSPVYPTRVAETCRTCHADPEIMAGRTLANGRTLPIDQFSRWQRSVHARALMEKNDLSAPTCNDCHGNHGATPPGLDSIVFVCGQCHGREAELFRESAKQAGFVEHNEYLEGAGEEGCAACHLEPEPQAAFTRFDHFTECSSCHGNHAVIRPTVAMLAPLPETPCGFCHEGSGPLAEEVPEPKEKLQNYEEMKSSLLASAESQGLTGSERFNWLVDQALSLPNHTVGRAEGGDGQTLRPEFQELFRKFRIGKTTFTYPDPVSGEEVQDEVVRCNDCHGQEPMVGEPVGAETGAALVRKTRELTSMAARAERILLAARRGGVETRTALEELEQAVDAQIELEVLVHTFAAEEGSTFAEKQAEGLEHARSALTLGQEALGELAFRRRGLAISLLVILAVLAALGLKIRQISG